MHLSSTKIWKKPQKNFIFMKPAFYSRDRNAQTKKKMPKNINNLFKNIHKS